MIANQQFEDYLTNLIEEEPQHLKELSRQTYLKTVNPRMLSGHIQGRLLSLISKLLSPKNILEIGTYTGYSALCLAEGLDEKGKLITIDCDEELDDFRKKYIEYSPYKNNIELITADAKTVIPTLNNKFDLIFIDADKLNYSLYFDLIIDKVNPNGCILTDNVLWSGKVYNPTLNTDEDTIAIHQYNQKLAKDSRVTSIILPIRDGISISRVK